MLIFEQQWIYNPLCNQIHSINCLSTILTKKDNENHFIAGVDYSMGWDIAMNTLCNIFAQFWLMVDGFKKVSIMCDRNPPFATLINRILLFPPRMKKERKTNTDTGGIFD